MRILNYNWRTGDYDRYYRTPIVYIGNSAGHRRRGIPRSIPMDWVGIGVRVRLYFGGHYLCLNGFIPMRLLLFWLLACEVRRIENLLPIGWSLAE